MIYIGLESVRFNLDNNLPILWNGGVISIEEATLLLGGYAPPPIKEIAPLPKPTEEVIAARIAACKACNNYREESDKCNLCGCGAVVQQRSASPLGSCPDKKWP
jgi:hypothetical protein